MREFVLRRVREALGGPRPAIGIGSPRASLEANFALRELVGPGRFYAGVADNEWRLTELALKILCNGPARPASLKDAGLADAVLVLGEDVGNTAPLLDLALRQAVRRRPAAAALKAGIPAWHDLAVRNFVQEARGPLFIAAARRTSLAGIGDEMLLAPDATAQLGFTVARVISGYEPAPGLPSTLVAAAERIARDLDSAERPLVVAGAGAGSAAVLRAAGDVARALTRPNRRASLMFVVPECDSLGLAMLGAGSLKDAVDAVGRGEAGPVIVLENDLYRRLPERQADAFFEAAGDIILLDHVEHRTAARAATVVPVGTFAESEGTLVNNEGRAQRFFRVCPATAGNRESWRWLCDFSRVSGRGGLGHVRDLDDLLAVLAKKAPELAPVKDAAPAADTRIHGLKVARQTARASGRTAIHAGEHVREDPPPVDLDSPLSFSMEGTAGQPAPALIPRFWAPGWNSVQAVNKYQEVIGGPLRGGDPGLRLVEPPASVETPAPADGPRAESGAAEAGPLVVAVHHIFGSEELSALAEAVSTLIPEPRLLICPEDAAAFGVGDGDTVDLEAGGEALSLPAKVTADIARGVVGVPVMAGGGLGLDLPARGRIKAVRKP